LRSAAVFLKPKVHPQKKVVQKPPERMNSKTDWQLGEVSGEKPSHKLLSVLVVDQTPNNVFA
jgi:hypothetical protein